MFDSLKKSLAAQCLGQYPHKKQHVFQEPRLSLQVLSAEHHKEIFLGPVSSCHNHLMLIITIYFWRISTQRSLGARQGWVTKLCQGSSGIEPNNTLNARLNDHQNLPHLL